MDNVQPGRRMRHPIIGRSVRRQIDIESLFFVQSRSVSPASLHPPSRSFFSCPPDPRLPGLPLVRVENGGDEPREAHVDFRAARRVVHLDSLTRAMNEARFAQGLEVL